MMIEMKDKGIRGRGFERRSEGFGRTGAKLYSFPIAVAVILHFLTLGIFSNFFYLAKHNLLPVLNKGDIVGKRAWAFLFIPFYNFYWIFHAWSQLIDRLNLQLRLKGRGFRIPKVFVIVSLALCLIPYINLVFGVLFWPFCIGFVQHGINLIVE